MVTALLLAAVVGSTDVPPDVAPGDAHDEPKQYAVWGSPIGWSL